MIIRAPFWLLAFIHFLPAIAAFSYLLLTSSTETA